MNPFFNPNAYHTSQLQQLNGASSSTPQQVNPLQMGGGGGGVPNPHLNQFIPNQLLNNNPNNPFMGQFMPQNNLNPNQLFNQNVNLGQWNLNNPMQNMNMNTNPFLAMGLANLAQGIGPQNLAILASAQLALMNANPLFHMGDMGLHGQGNLCNMQGIGPPQVQGNLGNMQGIGPPQVQGNLGNMQGIGLPQVQGNLGNMQGIGPPQVQGNLGNMQGIGLSQVQQNHQNYNQALAQVSSVNVTNNNHNGNWNKPPNKYNQKHDSFHNRSVPFHHGQPGIGNFGPPKDTGVKGHQDESPSKENQGEKKRPHVLTYTDQEIKQWREQRKKNYPLQATLQKKLADEVTASEARDEAAKLRRQQLKEVLAKQAELGCEVAEIPSSYLSDSEHQVHGVGLKRPFNRKERFPNKFNKGGRFQRNDKFSRRPDCGNHDPSNESEQRNQFNQKRNRGNNKRTRQDGVSKKEPTLLQKLLSADIKREKHQLLQVFRFMVMNSFFKDLPEKDLKFPPVMIKDADYESAVVEEEGEIID